jgi:alkyldihydroxyacetonephosphate synthase
MAHFSHAYPEGCSIYFTFVGYRRKASDLERLYQRAWRRGLEVVASQGGTVSHHHGIGLHKKWIMGRELPGGAAVFRGLKAVLDPRGVMNPGKLWYEGEG